MFEILKTDVKMAIKENIIKVKGLKRITMAHENANSLFCFMSRQESLIIAFRSQ